MGLNYIKIFGMFFVVSLLIVGVSAQREHPPILLEHDSGEHEFPCHAWEFKVRIDKVTHDGSIFTEEYCLRNGFFMRLLNWLRYHAKVI